MHGPRRTGAIRVPLPRGALFPASEYLFLGPESYYVAVRHPVSAPVCYDPPAMTMEGWTTGELLVSPPNLEDAVALSAFAARTFRAAYDCVLPESDLVCYEQEVFSATRVRTEIADPRVRLRVARCGAALCGYSRLEATQAPPEIPASRPVELVRLYVDESWQRHGVGRALMDDVLSYAQEYDACWLRVWVRNRRAIDFYRRYRFDIVGEGPYEVGDTRETVLIMMRDGEA
jgi:ribosomal protein S18 acetylase RimI-like enzyme